MRHSGFKSVAPRLYRRSMPALSVLPAQRRSPARKPIGRGTPVPLGDSYSAHKLSTGEAVVIRRTARRKTGLAAFWEDGQAVIAVPARLSLEDEQYWVPRMVAKLEHGRLAPGRQIPASNEALMLRSLLLSTKYLGARAVPQSVRWVSNQNSRWGSATPARKSIRISHQVQGMPEWVLDYVLLHELAHLIHPNHSAAFWAELASYPEMETAKAFLAGASFSAGRRLSALEDGTESSSGSGLGGGMDSDVDETD